MEVLEYYALDVEPYFIEDFAEKTMKAFDIDKENMRDVAHDFVKATTLQESLWKR
jgi:hypothetical protein